MTQTDWTRAECAGCEALRLMPRRNVGAFNAGICERCVSSRKRWGLPGLRAAMAKADVSMRLLAREVEVSSGQIGYLAAGKIGAKPEYALAIADALCVSVGELLRDPVAQQRRAA